MEEMDIGAQLADMKEVDYHNTLMISTLIELLVEKQIVNREEILSAMRELDEAMLISAEDGTWTHL